MANLIDLAPQTTANTNPFNITFGATAQLEFKQSPEMVINKSLGTVDLDYVNTTGLMLSKGSVSALIPWSNILAIIY